MFLKKNEILEICAHICREEYEQYPLSRTEKRNTKKQNTRETSIIKLTLMQKDRIDSTLIKTHD